MGGATLVEHGELIEAVADVDSRAPQRAVRHLRRLPVRVGAALGDKA